MKTFVIIPAFNEGARIGKVIRESQKYSRNIVVVDDGSTDGYVPGSGKNKSCTVLKHVINLGQRLRPCEREASTRLMTGSGYAIIYIDSDGQHSPKDIPRLLKDSFRNADIVFAYRNLAKREHASDKKIRQFRSSTGCWRFFLELK